MKERAIESWQETWLETCLIPSLKPGQKLVIYNATFDKGGRIEELVRVSRLRGLVLATKLELAIHQIS